MSSSFIAGLKIWRFGAACRLVHYPAALEKSIDFTMHFR
jgi:hypothetical protein